MKKTQKQLFAERDELLQSHVCDVSKDDYNRVTPKIQLIEWLSKVENSSIAIYDLNTHSYLLESEEQKKLFGKSESNNINIAEILYKRIHPDDLPFVIDTDLQLKEFYYKTPKSQTKDFKAVYDFRVLNTQGIYRRYIHQTSVLEVDKNGKGWLLLIISNLLSENATDGIPQRRIINLTTGEIHLFENDEFSSGALITKREKEILHLIGQGYDSKGISQKLSISKNTVNNHRQNILRKTRTENTTQALLYCKNLGLIQS